jgi:replicative DNA helicase
VPTGFGHLDAKLGGLERRHVTTLGGPPGSGKTQMALQIARNVALWSRGQKRQSAIVIFSAEMTVERLVLRLASSATGVSTRAIRKNTASAQEAQSYLAALDHMAGLPIRVDETPSPTTMQMLNRVAMEALTHPDGIDLVVFDYLELAGDKGDEKEEARLGSVMRGLKLIAKRFNCPVLVLSQLNRESARRSTRIPELADLRGSSWIEALSQQVIFIMRPDSYASRSESTGKLTYENSVLEEMARKYGEGAAFIKIAKNRDEETGLVIMRFNAGSTQFVEQVDVKKTQQPPPSAGMTYAAHSAEKDAA